MRWSELVEKVREYGQYATEAEAEEVTRTVLSAFGEHVTGEERAELAGALPQSAARMMGDRIPALRPLTAAEFVDGLTTRRENATPATARWDASSVLGVVGGLAGDALLARLLSQLPPGYALLFGRAELAPATAPPASPASARPTTPATTSATNPTAAATVPVTAAAAAREPTAA